MMRQLLFYVIFPTFIFSEIFEQKLFDSNQAMLNKDYDKAVQLYESILDSGYLNKDLYYNLGNAYYRKNYLGQAIWAYKNAIKFYPRDEDAKYNLAVTNARMIDRIEMPESFFILNLYRNIKQYLTIHEWLGIGSVLVFFQALLFSFIKTNLLQLKYFKSIFSLLIVINLIVHGICFDYYVQLKKENSAVVISNEVEAYSGPSDNNTVLFIVNDGSIVDILNNQNDWYEIILIDGKKGWLKNETIRVIN